MALNANALTTVARLRQWVSAGLPEETGGRLSDEALEALINQASAALEAWCDRVLVAPAEPVTYTFDGDGGQRLILPEWPVVSVSGVTVDGDAVPARGDVLGLGYVVRTYEGWLALVGYRFASGEQNVTVSARLGYDATLARTDRRHRRALDDLEQACLQLAAHWFAEPSALPTPEAGRPELDAGLPAPVKGLLQPYRRWGV